MASRVRVSASVLPVGTMAGVTPLIAVRMVARVVALNVPAVSSRSTLSSSVAVSGRAACALRSREKFPTVVLTSE